MHLILVLFLRLTYATAVIVINAFDDLIHKALLRCDVDGEGEMKELLARLHQSVGGEEVRRLTVHELTLGAVPEIDVQTEVPCLGELIVALDADALGVGEEVIESLPIGILRTLGCGLVPDVGVAVDVA